MRNLKYIFGLALVLLASCFVASCNDDVKETLEQEWATVLDNYGVAYHFSDDGKCLGANGGIGKEDFDKMFIGHGWKHYATWEIDKNGKRLPDEYYHTMIGFSPQHYYFNSDSTLTSYYRSDAAGGIMKKEEVAYTFDDNYNNTRLTVLLLDTNEYLQITGWTLGEQPSFCMVRPLAKSTDGETTYGVSIYVQMTDKELKAMQDSAK